MSVHADVDGQLGAIGRANGILGEIFLAVGLQRLAVGRRENLRGQFKRRRLHSAFLHDDFKERLDFFHELARAHLAVLNLLKFIFPFARHLGLRENAHLLGVEELV